MISLTLDHRLEEVYDHRTREYFTEVLRTYNAESYRSTIVLLYSVVICDFLYKLTDLRDLYNDEKAGKILEEINAKRTLNPTSSEWENYLIEEIKKTDLLEFSDTVNLDYLKSHRNLSAHPALRNDNQLYKPSQENAKAHIRNIFEGIFIKPPVLSNKVFVELIKDLSQIKDRKMIDNELKKYLNARYFSFMRVNVKLHIFDHLWRFVFQKSNPDIIENRKINLQALRLIYLENKKECLELIKQNKQSFGRIDLKNTLMYVNVFLSEFPEIFPTLSEDSQTLIRATLSTPDYLQEQILSIYLSNSIEEHIELIKTISIESGLHFSEDYFINLYLKFRDTHRDKMIDAAIYFIKNCKSYDTADYRYEGIIKQMINDFNKKQTIELLEVMNNNSQFWDRRKYSSTKTEILEHCMNVQLENSDLSNYHNLELI